MCTCEDCRNCKARAHRKANPELYREADRRSYYKNRDKKLARHRKWREENKEKSYQISRKTLAKVEAIKTENPCLDCRHKFPPECMDFDHVRSEKVDNVSHLVVGRYSWETILNEIAKCDIVCANCHRIRTKARTKATRNVLREM